MIVASIVTYKTDLNELATCLNCLKLCPQVSVVEVVDNSRSDNISLFIAEKFPDIIYTPSDNIGYGAANNISIRKSLAGKYGDVKYHLVLNSDVVFLPNVIDILVGKLEKDSSVGLIMPAVIGKDGNAQSCCHPLPTPFDLIIHRFAPEFMFRNWRRYYDLYPQSIKHDINVPYMHGCFMLFRLDALRHAGVFDERFFMYPEDMDITRRIHATYKTLVTPDAIMYHLHRAESRHSLRMLYIHAVNMIRYFAKWGFIIDRQRKSFNRDLHMSLEK